MTDGPLIVQSDKTLLLEVDHPLAPRRAAAIAPFAELERSPEHVHTYRLTPLGLWNARAAGHDAEQVVDALVRYSRYAVPHALLVDVADTMDRYGRLQLVKHPTHGLVLRQSRPRRARGGPAAEEDRADARAAHRRRHRARPPVRARPAQAGAAQGRLAGRGPGRLRRRRGARDRAPSPTAGSCATTSGRRWTSFWAGGSGRRRAALRRRQDARRRGGDGRGQARPRSSSSPTPSPVGSGSANCWPARRSPRRRSASTPANARRFARSPSPPTRS